MARHEIRIDMDAKCPRCGNAGVANGGLCLQCAAKKLMEGDDTFERSVAKTIHKALLTYRGEIRDARENGETNVAMSLKFSEDGPPEVSISFVRNRVKDTFRLEAAGQTELFGEDE